MFFFSPLFLPPPPPPRGFSAPFRSVHLQSNTCVLPASFGRPGGPTLPRRRAALMNASEAKSHFFGARFRRWGSAGAIRTPTVPPAGTGPGRGAAKKINRKGKIKVTLVALIGGKLRSSFPERGNCPCIAVRGCFLRNGVNDPAWWLHPVETAQHPPRTQP